MSRNTSAETAPAKLAESAADNAVLFKLTSFSVALGAVPLSSYFFSMYYVWGGNSTYAAITAIVSANIVLVLYILMSISEDKGSQTPVPKQESKKDI